MLTFDFPNHPTLLTIIRLSGTIYPIKDQIYFFMKSAVIKTGGKQYLVQEGDKLSIEKIPANSGSDVNFDQVLMIATDKATKIGTPLVSGAKVLATIIDHGLSKKISGVKMKAKKRNRKYFGHRQNFTKIEIKKISGRTT